MRLHVVLKKRFHRDQEMTFYYIILLFDHVQNVLVQSKYKLDWSKIILDLQKNQALIFCSLFLTLFRILEQSVYSQHDVVELVSMLVGAPTIEEQADILHYLVLCYGPRYKILAAQVRVIHILRYQFVFVCLFVCLFWEVQWGLI